MQNGTMAFTGEDADKENGEVPLGRNLPDDLSAERRSARLLRSDSKVIDR